MRILIPPYEFACDVEAVELMVHFDRSVIVSVDAF